MSFFRSADGLLPEPAWSDAPGFRLIHPREGGGGSFRKACFSWFLGTILLFFLGITRPVLAGAVTPVSAGDYPWSGYVRVTTNIGTSCTGALVGPSTVVTAAHCLYNRHTQAMLGAGSLHVLFGYDRGAFRQHSLVDRTVTDPAFVPGQSSSSNVVRDWAMLHITTPAPASATILPVSGTVAPGTAARLAGFRQSKAQILTGDVDCHIQWVRPSPSGDMLGHDCASEHGVSGAPLLVRQGDHWALAGLRVGTRNAQPGMAVAVAANAFSGRLK